MAWCKLISSEESAKTLYVAYRVAARQLAKQYGESHEPISYFYSFFSTVLISLFQFAIHF